MPLVATRGAASAQGFGEFAQSAAPVYIEDVMSVFLYTGNGSTQTITNGIDLSTYGGLVWSKSRNTAGTNNLLVDTVRGFNSEIFSNLTNAAYTGGSDYTAWNTNGYSLGYVSGNENLSGRTYVSWTFRKQPKFFDVVTYTGNGSVQNIAHNLGSAPGAMLIKRTSSALGWYCYHRSLGNSATIVLNSSNAQVTGSTIWNNTDPTSTQFTVGNSVNNTAGETYVAYLFAHNAGGFGLTGTDNVISCGSFTTNASGGVAAQNLGYEPQFIIYKCSSSVEDWRLLDNMRGMWVGTPYNASPTLYPNLSNAENNNEYFTPTATGFSMPNGALGNSATYIYIAIRRGPMKTPTSGTSVFNTAFRNAAAGLPQYNSGFVTDFAITMDRDGSGNIDTVDRLRGTKRLLTYSTNAESNGSPNTLWDYMNGYGATSGSVYDRQLSWMYRRAPGFFDEVCYTGDSSLSKTINHNLTVAPELIITKARNGAFNWIVGLNFTSSNYQVAYLDATNAASTLSYSNFSPYTTKPTASSYTVSSDSAGVNGAGYTYVAYLFASCPGVSKVTNFTGTGSLQTINCGFTSGARWVLVKRTDAAGDWYVWDSARGISSSNDPYLLLNSTAAEVTTTNWVDTTSTGFQVTAAAGNNVNINGASYIALAIA